MIALKFFPKAATRQLLALVIFLGVTTAFANVPGGGTGTGANVTLTDSGSTVTIANGIVSILCTKSGATIDQINYTYNNGSGTTTAQLLSGGHNGGQLYWETGGFGGGAWTYTLVVNPASNGGNYAEISLLSSSTTNGIMEVHFSLTRGATGFYVAAIWGHRSVDGVIGMGETRDNIYAGSTFNWMSVDATRNRVMEVAANGGAVGVQGAPVECSLWTNGIYQGRYEDKYKFSADFGTQRVWGWSSVGSGGKNVGLWNISASAEYYNGGPMKRELMEHIGTTILNMHNGGHYAMGTDASWNAGEIWTKVYGPYFIYCNNVTNTITTTNLAAQALFNDALAQGVAEQTAWPYYWFTNANYAMASNRGTITGQIVINDAGNPNASESNLWVGVVVQPSTTDGVYDFQQWMKPYQFWVKTDGAGNFVIPDVIATNNYTLYAFGPGAEGTFMSQNQTGGNPPLLFNLPASPFSVTMTGGATNNLGTVTWTPSRVGPTVFEIGYPDRTAGKFRHGDDWWVGDIGPSPTAPSPIWSKWLEFPFDFPSGPNYVVGTSRWTTDWNFIQPVVTSSTGIYNNSSSTITFNLTTVPAGGQASLFVGTTSDYYAAVVVNVNGTTLVSGSGSVTAAPSSLPSTGYSPAYSKSDTSIREGNNAANSDERITFPASLLHTNLPNTITLTIRQTGGSYFADHAMYDYLRLELTGYIPPAPAGVFAYAGNNCNLISWPVTPGATGYNILRSTSSVSGYVSITNGMVGPLCGSGWNNATYLDTSAVNDTTYYYEVKSVNPTGSSTNSPPSAGTTPSAALSTSAPAAPAGVVVGSSGHQTVTLNWSASANANYYTVWRSALVDSGGGSSNTLSMIVLNNTNTGTSYTDNSPTDGSIYSYSVTATGAGGTSSNSVSAVAVPLPVAPATSPGSFAGSVGSFTNITLNWSAVSGAVGYVVSRASTSNGTYNYLMSITETTYTDYGLKYNSTNYYHVLAMNAGGVSTNVSATVVTPPAAPTSLTAVAGNAQVILSWPASAGATSYVIKRGTSSGNETTTVISGYAGTSYTNTSLVNGTTNYFVVAATGPGGTGPNSPEASAAPYLPNLIWTGAANGTWNTSSINWLDGATAVPYADADKVVFYDTTRTNISISGSVLPVAVVFANTNANYILSATGAGISGTASLVKSNLGTLTLTTSNTYSGGTTVNGGKLLVSNLTGSATGSGLVTIGSGGTLGGNGFIAGSVTVSSGGHTRPGLNGAVTAMNSNLTYNAGAEVDFDLGSTYNGANGQVVLTGNTSILTCGGVTNGFNLTGATLDTNHDYVLFNLIGTTPTISGSFNPAPLWLGTTPPVTGTFSILKTNNTIVLHYTAAVPPVITAVAATPNPTVRGQTVTVSATITPGSGTINPANGVSASGSAMIGSSAFLVLSNGNVYTNRVTITNTATSGVQTLTVSVTDSTPFTRTAPLSLVLNPTTEIWNGNDVVNGNPNWNDGTNWSNHLFPLTGDSLVFDGPTNLLPNMEGAYSIAALTFDSSAGNFNLITTNPAAVLTLTGGVTNNSPNAQTLAVPVLLNAPVTFLAASGNLTVSGAIADTGGGLITDGSNMVTLAGTNIYSGDTTINNGTLVVGATGQLGGGNYTGNLTNNGTFADNSTAAQTLSGIISGTGALNQNGSGTLTLSAADSYTGNTIINGGTLALNSFGSIASSPNIVLGAGATLDVSATGNFTVGATQTLAGRGSVHGDVTINGLLSPGDTAVGTLAFSNTLTLGGTNLFKLNYSPLTNDAVIVVGALTNGGTLLVTNLGAGALAAGNSFQLFNAGNYNGAFANVILPVLPVGLAWNTNLLNTAGTISVILTTTPAFGPVAVAGGNLVFSGNGGVGGANYILLEATNLATSAANWTPILTNQFDQNGNFNLTNPVDPNAPQSFYRIELP